MLLYDRARISQKNHWLNEDGYVYFVFPITEISLKWGKCFFFATLRSGQSKNIIEQTGTKTI